MSIYPLPGPAPVVIHKSEVTDFALTVRVINRIETLTSREHEVMTHVITGILNKQIAAELGISEETVKIHRGRMMHKLGLVAVAELVRLCERAGVPPAGEVGREQ